MANVRTKKNIDFKIVPEKSQFIIGSQSIYSDDNYFFTELNHINSLENIRKKRIFDIYSSILIFFFSPLLMIFIRKKIFNIKEIFQVLIGNKTWIGYHESNVSSNLPKIKPCVFSVLNDNQKNNEEIINKVNIIYAKDYSMFLDLNLLLKKIFKSY